mgnify:CR=1 FL=1
MALLKIKAGALHAPLFVEAFMFSMIYGLGFVGIFVLGLTVATKQPAMTAQTLAGACKPGATIHCPRATSPFSMPLKAKAMRCPARPESAGWS